MEASGFWRIRSVTGGSGVFKWMPLRTAPKLVLPGYLQGSDTPLYDCALELLGSVTNPVQRAARLAAPMPVPPGSGACQAPGLAAG
jgi:hypothetical protein